jgi:hypothetical protein
MPGLVQLLLSLFGNLAAGFLQLLLGLLGKLLVSLRGLAHALFFQLPAEFRGFLCGLLLGVTARIIRLGAALLRRSELVVLSASQIRV